MLQLNRNEMEGFGLVMVFFCLVFLCVYIFVKCFLYLFNIAPSLEVNLQLERMT